MPDKENTPARGGRPVVVVEPAAGDANQYLKPAWPTMDITPDHQTALVRHQMRQEELENAWRREAISSLLKLFYWINGVVLAFLVLAWAVETAIPSAPQIISDKTILALIAGSTAQLGALALFVGRAMVSRRRPPAGNDDSAG